MVKYFCSQFIYSFKNRDDYCVIVNHIINNENKIYTFRNKNGYVYVFTKNKGFFEEKTEKEVITILIEISENVFGIKDKNYSFFYNIYKILVVHPKIAIAPDYTIGNMLAFNDCILDIDTHTIYLNNGSIFNTYKINSNYNTSNFATPIFDEILFRYSGGDKQLEERILQMIGYMLVPDKNGQMFLLLSGPAKTGKSSLLNILTSFFSQSAVSGVSLEELGSRFKITCLSNSAINICGDLSSDAINAKSIATLKRLLGNDIITAEKKKKDLFSFYNKCKIAFCSNHPIVLNTEDDGFLRRMVVVPLYNKIEDNFKRYNLAEELHQERDAIVRKLLAAYYRLVANNYIPQEIDSSYGIENVLQIKTFPENTDMNVQAFIDSCCIFDCSSKLHNDTLYQAYKEFCLKNNLQFHNIQNNFTAEMKQILSNEIAEGKISYSRFRLNNNENKSENKNGVIGLAIKSKN